MSKIEEAKGWGIRVGGPSPYLAYEFHFRKEDVLAALTEPYHRPVKVVMLPLAEWRRLKKAARGVL